VALCDGAYKAALPAALPPSLTPSEQLWRTGCVNALDFRFSATGLGLPSDPPFQPCGACWSFVAGMESVHIVLDPILERTTNADRYEVKAAMGACFSPHRKKITRRVHEVSQFHVVDGLDGVHKGPLLPRPHLDENDSPFFHGYDVDLSHGAKEVPLEDAVAAETEKPARCAFSSFSRF
jgi:hypothetical protein